MNPLSIPSARVRFSTARRWYAAALAVLSLGLAPGVRAGTNTVLGDGAAANLDTAHTLNNTALGYGASNAAQNPDDTTAVGSAALYNNLASGSTAIGSGALQLNSIGSGNTATGYQALTSNTDGFQNTATGCAALSNNVGNYNTAVGFESLESNTGGSSNTAVGRDSLLSNSDGSENTAVGVNSLLSDTGGSENTAVGYQSLALNESGKHDTAMGYDSLLNSTADNNTAIGHSALQADTTGAGNTAVGYEALKNSVTANNNTALGVQALENNTGGNNLAFGSGAGINLTTGSGNIDLGSKGVAGESNAIRVGTVGLQKNVYLAGVSGVTVAGGVPVVIDTNGHLGAKTSSERFKEDITPMDRASEAILQLNPVSFRYKPEYDPGAVPQFGLIAEQVAKVSPDLVARDAQGQIYTVRYDEVSAMLLNEFLKEHRQVASQQDTIAQLRADLDAQRQALRDLAALVQGRNAPPAP